jgi:hypothetical protein
MLAISYCHLRKWTHLHLSGFSSVAVQTLLIFPRTCANDFWVYCFDWIRFKPKKKNEYNVPFNEPKLVYFFDRGTRRSIGSTQNVDLDLRSGKSNVPQKSINLFLKTIGRLLRNSIQTGSFSTKIFITHSRYQK